MAIILSYNGVSPKIHPSAFIAENAVIIGDVEIGAESNIWYNVVIRGDVNYIKIGERTNIQDGSVIHVSRFDGPTIIGSDVTIGHMALIHAATIEDLSFIGMGSKLLDFSVVKTHGMVGAGALISPKKIVGSKELWTGVPAKMHRPLTQDEIDYIKTSADNYVTLASTYKQ
jgi:gamma-carbonic anhydrase